MGNLRVHEYLGLIMQFLGASSCGIGIYYAIWFGMRPLLYRNAGFTISGGEWLLFPLFFGLGGLLWSLGNIEIKDALPGHKRRKK